MNLSLLFLVLSAFVLYLLYDMFKKSRQQQQLANAQHPSKPLSTSTSSRLKPNYQSQCSLLHQLHQAQLTQLKHRNISLHFQEDHCQAEVNFTSLQAKLTRIIKEIASSHYNVYLLVCRKKVINNPLVTMLRKIPGVQQIGFEGIEGAVAVLRQLNCGIHLQSDSNLHPIITQYLPSVWFAHNNSNSNKTNSQIIPSSPQFKNEADMLIQLEVAVNKKLGKQTKEE